MILTGQIKVQRDQSDKSIVHESVRSHIRKKTLIGIFPEGTRSPFEFDMLKAFTGIAKYSLEHDVPIIPVGITGTYRVMSKYDRVPKFKKMVEINIAEALSFKEHVSKQTDREICVYVTEEVMKKIEKLSGKKYKHYESKQLIQAGNI